MRRGSRVLLSFPTILLLTTIIVACVKSENPFHLTAASYGLIGISLIPGLYIVYLDSKLTGIFTSIIYAVFFSFYPSISPTLTVLLFVGFAIGSIIHKHSIIPTLLAIVIFLGTWAQLSSSAALLFVGIIILTFVLVDYVSRVSKWLHKPFRDLRSFAKPLIGFGLMYVGVSFLFAALYKTIYIIDPVGSYEFSESIGNDRSFFLFLYLSFSALKSAPPSDIVPTVGLSRSVAVLESFVGLFFLVVFVRVILVGSVKDNSSSS